MLGQQFRSGTGANEMPHMKDWQERIVTDSGTLLGKPRIKGTRIGVAFLLDRLADGWSETDILESYPNITREDLQAVFAFVRDCMQEETYVMEPAVQTGKVPR
jgi:uncharacterized protein (DUF433 family)